MSAWGRAGVDQQTYNTFLSALEDLNARYAQLASQQVSNDIFDEVTFGGTAEQGEMAGTNLLGRPAFNDRYQGSLDTRAQLRADFEREFQDLASTHGIQTQVVDDGKIYYMDPGNPFSRVDGTVNPYDGAQFEWQPGSATGGWIRDRRTDSYQINDFVGDAIPAVMAAAVTGGLGAAGQGGLSAGGVVQSGVRAGLQGYDDNEDDNAALANSMGFWGGDSSQGHMPTEPDRPRPPPPLPTVNGIGLPIPGLPFPLPGNMRLEDLVDIARATGRGLMDILSDITQSDSGAGSTGSGEVNEEEVEDEEEDPPVDVVLVEEDEESPGLLQDEVARSEEDRGNLTLGQPEWWEGGSLPGIPAPVDIPDDNADPEPVPPYMLAPGETGGAPSGGAGEAGSSAAVLGLLPLMVPDNPPPIEIELWDYIGADDSWGWERPDYGTVEQNPLYQFAQQPSQPSQVGYRPEPRQDYLSVLQQEQRRRQQRGLL
jgi:hypothetical protein